MKKYLLLAAGLLMAVSANAGEYRPYLGFDYVNMTPNLKGRYENSFAENYDLGSLTAGVKFVDYGSIEFLPNVLCKKRKL